MGAGRRNDWRQAFSFFASLRLCVRFARHVTEPIRYFHRAKQVVETEQVYGEKWVRWTYGSKAGNIALHALAKRHIASWYYGWRMNRQTSANKVLPFIVEYDLDVDEFAKSPFLFKTFNEFFYRALKPGARPLATPADERVAVLPADGRHLAFQNVDATAGFYAKGQRFDLAAFLGDPALAAEFAGGSLLISPALPPSTTTASIFRWPARPAKRG